ncbi:MAG: winged helix-turn-helix transcriptional regulator [Treponema sp.]|nr:winged helix-turn-helix transcriptional regulator [Treponema sp.]
MTFEKLLIYYGAKGIRLNEDTFRKNLGFYTYDGKYTKQKIIYFVKQNPNITREELAQKCGISIDGIKWQLKQLKGKIKHIGSDKTGCWIIENTEEEI